MSQFQFDQNFLPLTCLTKQLIWSLAEPLGEEEEDGEEEEGTPSPVVTYSTEERAYRVVEGHSRLRRAVQQNEPQIQVNFVHVSHVHSSKGSW